MSIKVNNDHKHEIYENFTKYKNLTRYEILTRDDLEKLLNEYKQKIIEKLNQHGNKKKKEIPEDFTMEFLKQRQIKLNQENLNRIHPITKEIL